MLSATREYRSFQVPTAQYANSGTSHLSNVNHTHISQLVFSTWVEICQICQDSNLLLHLFNLLSFKSPITATLSRQNRIKKITTLLFSIYNKCRTFQKLSYLSSRGLTSFKIPEKITGVKSRRAIVNKNYMNL